MTGSLPMCFPFVFAHNKFALSWQTNLRCCFPKRRYPNTVFFLDIGGGSSANSNSAPTSSAQKHQARQLQENKTAELSYDVVPTHRLAFILREVALKTEPKNTSDIIFHRREESMASTLVGFDGRVLAVVGCQHIAGLQKELEKLGYSSCNTAADARGN